TDLTHKLDIHSIPVLPAELAEILQQCFKAQPEMRPRDMLEIANSLQVVYQQITKELYPRLEPKAAELRANGLNNLALSLLDLGQEDKAAAAWEKAIEVDPQHLETTYNRGLELWRGAQITDETLLERIRQATSSHSEEWLTLYMIGLVHLERGNNAAAFKVFSSIKEPDAEREEVVAAITQATNPLISNSKQLLNTFSGHTQMVTSVSLSADGRYALSGGLDTTLKLWDAASRSCLRTFQGHKGMVTSVSLSADGHYALSSSYDKTIKLWELDSGSCLRTIVGHTDLVTSACLSPNGRFALSSSSDQTIKLWELANSRCLYTFEGHTEMVTSVCLSSDGRYALSGSADKMLKLWDVASGRCLRTFEGHKSSVLSVCLSADGRYALSGSYDKTLKLWDVASGDCKHTFKGHAEEVTAVSLSPNGRYALSSSYDKTLKLWELDRGRVLRTIDGHRDAVTSLCLSADGRFALSGSWDETLKLWDVLPAISSPEAPFWVSRVHTTQEVLSSQVSYDEALLHAQHALELGHGLAAADYLRRARAQPGFEHTAEALELWHRLYRYLPRKSLSVGRHAATFKGHTGMVESVFLSADGRYALSGSEDKTLKLWELESGRCLRTFEGHMNKVSAVCLSADGRYALSGGGYSPIFQGAQVFPGERDQTLKLWDVNSGRCIRTIEEHTGVTSVSVSANGRYALSGSGDGKPKLWDLTNGHCLRTFDGHSYGVISVCLSADGRYALSSSDQSIKLWELASGRCLRTIDEHFGYMTSVCLTASGHYALSGVDQTLKLWELASGRCLRTIKGHTDRVTSVSLSVDGRFALSGSRDTTLKLWELANGRCLRTFEGHTDWVSSVSLSADGRFALSGSEDKTIRLWTLDWELEDREPADWDDGALPFLKNFLTIHIPYAAHLSASDNPSWSDEDFQGLIRQLQFAGYGWLRPEGVRLKLDEMAKNWQGPQPFQSM
ncbi:MAG: tetratricopeptide repeat protein, partial [Anaerolineales bacterium]